MNNIYIEHNPFLIETIFNINGQVPAGGFTLNKCLGKRIQFWIETFFSELQNLFNGEGDFDLTFKGVESDWMDITEAAELEKKSGMNIQLKWIPVKETDVRLADVKKLMIEARLDSTFNKYLDSDIELSKKFDDAFNNDFDVYVVATMSSGKSTLLNAMLGKDLFPAANEATTATIAQITDNKKLGKNYTGQSYDINDDELNINNNLSLELMKEWNFDKGINKIKIEGNITAISERDNVRLVLTDTPGPNNSQDARHELTTMSYIQDSARNPLILYVLNATQLGTNDDKNLLGLIAEKMKEGGKQSKDRFIFVINKMDNFDPENGECVSSAINNTKTYLSNNGIDTPTVYPISALLSRLLRLPPEVLSRKERRDKNALEELFLEESSMNLQDYMPLNSKIKTALENRNLEQSELRSGVPAIESMIDEHINKYSFPDRLTRAYGSLKHLIDKGLCKAEMEERLECEEQDLDTVKQEIDQLKEKQEKGFNTKSHQEKVQREGKELPDEVQDMLTALEINVSKKINEYSLEFEGDVAPRIAKSKLMSVVEELSFYNKKIINEYEVAFLNSQTAIKTELQIEYKKHVEALFSDSKNLQLPTLEGLKDTIESISLNLDVTDEDIAIREIVTGTKTVSNSTWYKPWTYFSEREEDIVEDEEYINLDSLWEKHKVSITGSFNELVNSARDKIENDKLILIDKYLKFLDSEFSSKFDALIKELVNLVSDADLRKKAIEDAKIEIIKINEFEKKLDSVLKL
ncbi:MAG: dynamin family protein [Saccharospirillaceae bacterium]|nr:dynamin family protein [Pseudomonadales bacterium]NRB78686.1 dynamin family protein [Saccharospirillaceae bacterium]